MDNKRTRREYDLKFKVEAVKLITDHGRSVREVAAELGVHEGNLHRWKREILGKSNSGKEVSSNFISQEEELKRLRKENAELRQERDFLKKTAGYFAKNQK